MKIIEKIIVPFRTQRTKLLSLILSSFLFFPLMSCDKANLDNSLPELTFTHRPIIQLDVKKIEIINEYKMPLKKGIQGIFSVDQSKRFKGTVEVRLDIFKDQRKAVVRASASRSHTLREDASPNTQARLWYNIVESLMQSFDREIREQVNSHFQKYLK